MITFVLIAAWVGLAVRMLAEVLGITPKNAVKAARDVIDTVRPGPPADPGVPRTYAEVRHNEEQIRSATRPWIPPPPPVPAVGEEPRRHDVPPPPKLPGPPRPRTSRPPPRPPRKR